MKIFMFVVGAIVSAVGIAALILHNGIHYTKIEKFPPKGPVQTIVKRERVARVPVALSAVTLACGVALIVAAAKTK